MDARVRELVTRLHAQGQAYDAQQPDRLQRRRNLEPDSAALLATVVRASGAVRVTEIGTSNGVSAIWLAEALRDTGGRLVSVDLDAAVQEEARANLRLAGLSELVELRHADGGEVLARTATGALDVLFLDSERPEYPGWWQDIRRVLRPGGVLAVDNVISHPDEVEPLLALVEEDATLSATVVPVGKGLLLAVSARH
jgi:predicted O-methyltransferase YrrM